jgi:hypothetical protein
VDGSWMAHGTRMRVTTHVTFLNCRNSFSKFFGRRKTYRSDIQLES